MHGAAHLAFVSANIAVANTRRARGAAEHATFVAGRAAATADTRVTSVTGPPGLTRTRQVGKAGPMSVAIAAKPTRRVVVVNGNIRPHPSWLANASTGSCGTGVTSAVASAVNTGCAAIRRPVTGVARAGGGGNNTLAVTRTRQCRTTRAFVVTLLASPPWDAKAAAGAEHTGVAAPATALASRRAISPKHGGVRTRLADTRPLILNTFARGAAERRVDAHTGGIDRMTNTTVRTDCPIGGSWAKQCAARTSVPDNANVACHARPKPTARVARAGAIPRIHARTVSTANGNAVTPNRARHVARGPNVTVGTAAHAGHTIAPPVARAITRHVALLTVQVVKAVAARRRYEPWEAQARPISQPSVEARSGSTAVARAQDRTIFRRKEALASTLANKRAGNCARPVARTQVRTPDAVVHHVGITQTAIAATPTVAADAVPRSKTPLSTDAMTVAIALGRAMKPKVRVAADAARRATPVTRHVVRTALTGSVPCESVTAGAMP